MSSISASSMVASNQRPIPLKKRADLVVAKIDYLGVGYQVIKDPIGLKYHRLQVEQYRILELLNGSRSLEAVRNELKKEFPTLQISLSDIQQLITDLHKKGLVVSDRPGQGAAVVRERKKTRKEKIKQTLMSLLSLRLPGWDPERTLHWMHPFIAWIFRPAAVFVCMSFVVSAWLLLAANLDEFRAGLPEFQSFFGWPNLIYLWFTLGAAKVIHEFGHGLSCTHYGGECHEMGVMVLVFSPCLYCDVTDSWMMKNKWHRIIIGAAGMYIEVILSAIAIYIWWMTKPGLLHHLALNMFFVTTITTVIFNANPLMRFDGYYMMSDYLEIPNLRQKSEKLLKEAFSWYCLGIESKPDPFMPETGRGWFITYAIAAWLYRWVVLVSISMFLYTVLKPYNLQSLGVTVLIFSMSGILFSMFRSVYQIIATPRMEPMSKPKIAVSLAIAGIVGWVAFTTPIPWYHEAPCILEPRGVVAVPAPIGGRILPPAEYRAMYEEMLSLERKAKDGIINRKSPLDQNVLLIDKNRLSLMEGMPTPEEYTVLPANGQNVEKDTVLAILEHPEDLRRQDQLRRRVVDLVVRTREVDQYDRIPDPAGVGDSLAEALELQNTIRDLVKLSAQRVIRAPISGTVVAAKRVAEQPASDIDAMKLAPWHGTPLDPENLGCSLDPGQEICSLAPSEKLQAVLYIDQGDREDLQEVKGECEIKLDHLPDITWLTMVSQISTKGENLAPEALTTRFQGPLATKPGDQGSEQLASTAYRAIAELHFDAEVSKADAVLMKPGMRGNARFILSNRTAAYWLYRYLCETFRFKV
jgi:putative peptide zinc metalloprotease protein